VPEELDISREKAFEEFIHDFRKRLRRSQLDFLEDFVETSVNPKLARKIADACIAGLGPIEKTMPIDDLQKNHLKRNIDLHGKQ
jgi:hypothetical protein